MGFFVEEDSLHDMPLGFQKEVPLLFFLDTTGWPADQKRYSPPPSIHLMGQYQG